MIEVCLWTKEVYITNIANWKGEESNRQFPLKSGIDFPS